MTKTTNKNNVKNFVDPYHGEIELDDEELHSYPSSSHFSNTNSYPVNGMARRVPHHHDHDRPRHDRNDDHQHHYHYAAGPPPLPPLPRPPSLPLTSRQADKASEYPGLARKIGYSLDSRVHKPTDSVISSITTTSTCSTSTSTGADTTINTVTDTVKDTACTTRRKIPFAVKLHDIVSDESIGFIQWLPCGKAFMITNKDKLAKLVLPIYFGAKLNQYSSFIWNLSRWQFKLIPPKRGERFRTYYHEQFIRGHRALSYSIKSNYLEQRRASPASYATAKNRQHPREHPTSNTTDFDVPPVVPTRYKDGQGLIQRIVQEEHHHHQQQQPISSQMIVPSGFLLVPLLPCATMSQPYIMMNSNHHLQPHPHQHQPRQEQIPSTAMTMAYPATHQPYQRRMIHSIPQNSYFTQHQGQQQQYYEEETDSMPPL